MLGVLLQSVSACIEHWRRPRRFAGGDSARLWAGSRRGPRRASGAPKRRSRTRGRRRATSPPCDSSNGDHRVWADVAMLASTLANGGSPDPYLVPEKDLDKLEDNEEKVRVLEWHRDYFEFKLRLKEQQELRRDDFLRTKSPFVQLVMI